MIISDSSNPNRKPTFRKNQTNRKYQTTQLTTPVLAVAIYHTPQDFFDLKDKILQINPNYKFMIRRSEDVLPCADLVLIAF